MNKEQALLQLQMILEGLLVRGSARMAQIECLRALRCGGWECRREVPVEERGDGHGGRVDIEARKLGWIAGIEIDRKTTRFKSVAKLNSREDWLKILVTRAPVSRRFSSVDAQFALRSD